MQSIPWIDIFCNCQHSCFKDLPGILYSGTGLVIYFMGNICYVSHTVITTLSVYPSQIKCVICLASRYLPCLSACASVKPSYLNMSACFSRRHKLCIPWNTLIISRALTATCGALFDTSSILLILTLFIFTLVILDHFNTKYTLYMYCTSNSFSYIALLYHRYIPYSF